MTIKLHHLNASRSQRLVWLLAELEAPHEIIHYKRQETNRAPESLLKIHPLGKAPILEDGDKIIAETGAIAEYLLMKFDPNHKLHPHPDAANYHLYLTWLHSAEGAPFLPGLLTVYINGFGFSETELGAYAKAEREKAVTYMEEHLAAHAYFIGDDFSAIDCLMGFGMESNLRDGFLDDKPASKAWLESVKARPAYQKMLAVGI